MLTCAVLAAPPDAHVSQQLHAQQYCQRYATVSQAAFCLYGQKKLCYPICHLLLFQLLKSSAPRGVTGYMYCNLPGLEAMEGQRIRIYYMALGTEVDLHTPSLAGASQVLPTGWLVRDLARVCRRLICCALPAHICNVVHD